MYDSRKPIGGAADWKMFTLRAQRLRSNLNGNCLELK